VVKIPGVTTTFQDDKALAEESLSALVSNFPDKTPKIIKMWIAGFPPMERREVIYQKYIKTGKIKELETVGEVGDFTNVSGLNANAIGSLLTKYRKGEIDAIWGSWDAFATGGYTALVENGRTEVKIFGIDVSNADLQLMQSKDSPWIMTAAADAQLVGVINLRLLLKKIAGESIPATFEIPATTIYQKDLSGSTTVETLAVVYDTRGKSESFNEDWMKAIRKAVAASK
jgi:simple sugar transport system substrate-binding protein